MQLIINGKPRTFSSGSSVAELIAQLGIEGRRIAVEVNEKIIPRSHYPMQVLKEDDRIEIIGAIGGG